MESGQSSFYLNADNSPAAWLNLSAALNCSQTHPHASNLTCIRNQTASVLKSTIEHLGLNFKPVSDNVTILRYPEVARANGSIARVPVLTGTNANEGTVFTLGQTNATAYVSGLLPTEPALVQTIVAAYPSPPYTAAQQVPAVVTDFNFQCPAGIVANDSQALAEIPTWRYFFNATFANTQFPPLVLGVYHSSEIGLVFGNYPRANATEQERDLSNYMQNAWATFAKNPAGGPGWEQVPKVAKLQGNQLPLQMTVDAGQLDVRCPLYKPVLDVLGATPDSA